jgi:Chaperone of endosialidase
MKSSVVVSLKFIAIALFFLSTADVHAQGVKISMQGILKKSNGNAVSDGTYAMTFKLYNVTEAGTALWSEVHPSVTVSGGLYSAVLGSVTSLNLPFNEDYYLGITIANTPEMGPRQQITTAPYTLSLKGGTNVLPSAGAIGAGTNTPTSGYQLHVKNGSGMGKQLVEGSTGANIQFIKSATTATFGFGASDNEFRLNPGSNNTMFQYNASNKLQVNTNGINVTGSGTFSNGLTQSSGTATLGNISISGNTFNNANETQLQFGGSTKLSITSEGVVVPAHLSISGSKNFYNSGRTARYKKDGLLCYTDNCDSDFSENYSINSNNRIKASEFNAFSDNRIKRDLVLSDGRKDLDLIRQLRVTDYRHIDAVAKGTAYKKGFIAQEVAAVFPEAVSITRDFVPDMYEKVRDFTVSAGALSMVLAQEHHLCAGDVVRLMLPDGQRDLVVGTVSDAHTFTITDWSEKTPEWVFVYGKQVDDFQQVDYDRIHTLNVSATQALIRQMEALENEIADLKNQNDRMKAIKDRLDTRVQSLEASISN